MVRFGRTDGNQKAIVNSLNAIPGVTCKVLSDVGGGFPDLCVGYMGVNSLIELKDGSPLTPAQLAFHGLTEIPANHWKGQHAIANTMEDVLRIIGIRITA